MRRNAMRGMGGVVGVMVLVGGAGVAEARPQVVEDFSTGNPFAWTFGPPGVTEPTGGNPGAFHHVDFLDTFAPQPRHPFNAVNPWTGDLRAAQATSIGVDLILFDVDFSADGRPLTLILWSDNGTPVDFNDDWGMYQIGASNVPLVGEGWKSFDFDVPSQVAGPTPPPGWQYIAVGPNSPAMGDWDALISDVAMVSFFYGDPTFFFIFQAWDLGMDNVRISTADAAAPVAGRFVVNDRTNDVIYAMGDADESGMVEDAGEGGEVVEWFSGANAAGTLAPMNPSTLATAANGSAAMGDQVNRLVYVMRDHNADGDAQDAGESAVYADAANLSGVSFAFPTGAAFDPLGRLHVVNAGNAFGNDGVYRVIDLNNDGDAQDAGEVTEYVGSPVFGSGNGAYSPQELAFDASGAGYLRNSSSGLHGVYRFVDANNNGRADDAGEFAAFWDATGASGVTPLAGFALERDPVRARAWYTQQVASGGVDQIVRIADVNNDGDAQDAGEAAIVYENAAAGFTLIDVVALADGRLLITDASADQVVLLTDGNSDGDFNDSGEAVVWFGNTLPTLGDARQIDPLASTACPEDVNQDGMIGFADLNLLLGVFGQNLLGNRANINGDGRVDFGDLNLLLGMYGLGCK